MEDGMSLLAQFLDFKLKFLKMTTYYIRKLSFYWHHVHYWQNVSTNEHTVTELGAINVSVVSISTLFHIFFPNKNCASRDIPTSIKRLWSRIFPCSLNSSISGFIESVGCLRIWRYLTLNLTLNMTLAESESESDANFILVTRTQENPYATRPRYTFPGIIKA